MGVRCSSSSSGGVVLMCLFSSAVSAYDFIIRNDKTGSDGNYYHEIRDGSTREWIGSMYQDSVFDASGRRLGLNQGYMFYFDNGTSSNYNNILFLGEGNEIYWMDGDIISASAFMSNTREGHWSCLLQIIMWTRQLLVKSPSSSLLHPLRKMMMTIAVIVQ